ncbi:hypothetical protein BVRB_6g133910 [Beta vulgaris subsp. vulgaris]|uniref:uncharacterized protein LOC104895527 n=1 Tax=Beta vulgaris subsp. vulgaris TaxID=3555 RepID=UPI00053FA24B|nr:uncharacterized protein LOC104895527 [Beta vulgaris subsp. vulgaris]KMT09292.1 hypothetical protein BVRB_6g133910 [Beta vulgaris subsp. vulgaris]
MGLLTANYWEWRIAYSFLSNKTHINGNPFGLTQLNPEFGGRIVAFAGRKSAKKLKRIKEQQSEVKLESSKISFNDNNGVKDNVPLKNDTINDDFALVNEKSELNSVTNDAPSRGAVLRACTVTSGLIAALGLAIRQVSQVASSGGLPVFDCSEVSFDFQVWHLELIAGLVVLISLSRYTLLKIWPDFAESSEAANRQVLTSLEAYDYLIVAFLPGISEELLFRGGLLPLLGLNWKSALAVAALFGVLHLGSGRKSSFAIWATFVGVAYGYATIVSSNLAVPMASHALNNLAGALLWQQTSRSSKQISS